MERTATTQPIQAQIDLAEAVLCTLLYADAFNFPMTAAEIHHFLINCSASLAEVQDVLENSTWLKARIIQVDGYFTVQDDLISQRIEREAFTQTLLPTARTYAAILAHLPFVRMIALTGALAVHNPNSDHDDLDYMLITKPGRVWTARA